MILTAVMMRSNPFFGVANEILLDTHILLWALSDDAKLSEKAKKIILQEGGLSVIGHP